MSRSPQDYENRQSQHILQEGIKIDIPGSYCEAVADTRGQTKKENPVVWPTFDQFFVSTLIPTLATNGAIIIRLESVIRFVESDSCLI